jgi:hypothetical protein
MNNNTIPLCLKFFVNVKFLVNENDSMKFMFLSKYRNNIFDSLKICNEIENTIPVYETIPKITESFITDINAFIELNNLYGKTLYLYWDKCDHWNYADNNELIPIIEYV